MVAVPAHPKLNITKQKLNNITKKKWFWHLALVDVAANWKPQPGMASPHLHFFLLFRSFFFFLPSFLSFLCLFFTLFGAIDNCSRLCNIVPALQTHGLRQYITVPCRLPAILTERGHKLMVALVMLGMPSLQATPAGLHDNGVC